MCVKQKFVLLANLFKRRIETNLLAIYFLFFVQLIWNLIFQNDYLFSLILVLKYDRIWKKYKYKFISVLSKRNKKNWNQNKIKSCRLAYTRISDFLISNFFVIFHLFSLTQTWSFFNTNKTDRESDRCEFSFFSSVYT